MGFDMDNTTKSAWHAPELKKLDVSETLGGVPFDVPEGTIYTSPDQPDLVAGS